jgi:hypothetical protein
MHDELRLYNIEQAIRNLNQQSDAIMARLRNVKPFVPWREEFPDRGRITSLQAQLFENDSRKGLSARVVKVYLWDRPEEKDNPYQKQWWPDGYYMPFVFPLKHPRDFAGQGSMTPIENWATDLRSSNRDWWVGCVENKGKRRGKQIDGTLKVMSHGAILAPTFDLALTICGEEYEFGTGEPAKKSDSEKAPTRIWYLKL